MGDDFMERYYRQIRRSIDKNFEKYLKTPDLFSGVAPDLSSGVVGIRVPGAELCQGQFLVHFPRKSAAGIFSLWSGANRMVDLSGEAAAQASQSGAVSAEVTSVSGPLVTLKFHSPYRRKR
jgi:hypothetical protein